jgi:hypothetical protein
MLEYIIPSKTRRKILALYFHNAVEHFHLRKVAREVDEEINAVKRELDILEKEGVLKKEKRANRVIYSLDHKYYFYDEFVRLFAKQNTLSTRLLKNTMKLGKIKYVALSLKYAKKQQIPDGENYLLVVGTIVVREMVANMEEEEKQFGQEINYSVMPEEEFAFRKKNNDPFIWGFLRQPKVMIIGDEGGLLT